MENKIIAISVIVALTLSLSTRGAAESIENDPIAPAYEKLGAGEFEQALEMLRTLHEAGNDEATRLVGCLYMNGDGVEKNQKKGREYLRKASNAGNPEATFQLGNSYRAADRKKYASLMESAAEQGHLIAAQQVGRAYYFGEGVPQNDIMAYKWLFCIELRTPVAVETWTKPFAELEERMNEPDKEKARVMAWNLVYIENRNGFAQQEFDRNNPGVDTPFTAEEYELREGNLIITESDD